MQYKAQCSAIQCNTYMHTEIHTHAMHAYIHICVNICTHTCMHARINDSQTQSLCQEASFDGYQGATFHLEELFALSRGNTENPAKKNKNLQQSITTRALPKLSLSFWLYLPIMEEDFISSVAGDRFWVRLCIAFNNCLCLCLCACLCACLCVKV